MNCEEAKIRWHHRYDNGCDNPNLDLDAHIESCESCRIYDSEMRLITSAIGELAAEPLPECESKPIVQPTLWQSVRLARVAAIIALAIGATWWTLRSIPQQNSHEIVANIAGGLTSEPSINQRSYDDERIGLSLRGESASKYLAMAKPTGVANVQVYWLYATAPVLTNRSGHAIDNETP